MTNMTNSASKSGSEKHKNRQSLVILLAVFLLPIILAKLALDNQWLQLGVTNHGKLIQQPMTLTTLNIDKTKFAEQWLIIYRLPDECFEVCFTSIETVYNSYVALGKDMPRVTPLLIDTNIFTERQKNQLALSQWKIQPITSVIHTVLPKQQVLIADPLGNIILSHTIPQTLQQQSAFSKAIVADMKKLLKYSKVG
jgi:hypothetical protein